MIPVATIKPLLRYFDSIDKLATAGLMFKKPHIETTITQNLCSMLDEQEEQIYNLDYSLSELRKDLLAFSTNIQISLKTHEYTARVENKLHQSDLGLIIKYINYYEPDSSWAESWLFQAKSLKPTIPSSLTYTCNSKFDNIEIKQINKINDINDKIGADLIKFIEYCPRAYLLNLQERSRLIYQRDIAFHQHQYFFNKTLDHELYNCLFAADKNLEPGIFISSITKNTKTKTYLDLYKKFGGETHPFSWFIVSRLLCFYFLKDSIKAEFWDWNRQKINRVSLDSRTQEPKFLNDNNYLNKSIHQSNELAYLIVQCKKESVDILLNQKYEKLTLYPSRTLTLCFSIGRE